MIVIICRHLEIMLGTLIFISFTQVLIVGGGYILKDKLRKVKQTRTHINFKL